MPTLLVKSGAASGQRFEFQKDIEIGRGSTLDLPINDRTLSRRHAALSRTKTGWSVTDLRSANGTVVNGRLIKEPTSLHNGDEVRLGAVLFEFRSDPEAHPPRRRETSVTLSDVEPAILEFLRAESPATSLFSNSEKTSLDAMSQRLKLLYDIGETISQTLDEDTMLSLILDKMFEVFPQADRGFIMLYEPESGQLTPKAACTRSGESSEIAMSRTLVWDVIKNRRGILSVDVMADNRFEANQTIRQLGIRSVVGVPMISRDADYGVIALDSAESESAFDKDDMALLLAIASQAALSLANAQLHRRLVSQELLERDLALAKKIQTHFLPRTPPETKGYDFCDYYVSALEVGGDYYDFVELPGHRVGIAVGDVSGKGISAALYMVKLSTEVRFHCAGQIEPSEILKRVNRSLFRDLEEGMFVTCVVLVLNTETRELRVSTAGHASPLVRRGDGSIVQLSSPRNSPLGVREDPLFEQRTFELQPQDTVVLFTDGLSEAEDRDGQLFGEDRLIEAMRTSEGTPEGVMNAILSAVKNFLAGQPQSDDITLVCFGPVSDHPPHAKGPTQRLAAVRTDSSRSGP